MNFLEIAKRVRQECGISGDGPPNVAGQSGMYAKIIAWVQSAHEAVQQLHAHWDFDWAEHTQALSAGVESYDPASDWGLDVKRFDGGGLYVYRNTDGPAAKVWVPLIDWPTFRYARQPNVTGLPTFAAHAPNGKLYFFPIPDAGLTAVMEFYREPQVLAGNTDVPRMPARFHMAIVWRAVMFWCAHDENPGLWQSASQNYKAIIDQMVVTELPDLTPTEPLA